MVPSMPQILAHHNTQHPSQRVCPASLRFMPRPSAIGRIPISLPHSVAGGATLCVVVPRVCMCIMYEISIPYPYVSMRLRAIVRVPSCREFPSQVQAHSSISKGGDEHATREATCSCKDYVPRKVGGRRRWAGGWGELTIPQRSACKAEEESEETIVGIGERCGGSVVDPTQQQNKSRAFTAVISLAVTRSRRSFAVFWFRTPLSGNDSRWQSTSSTPRQTRPVRYHMSEI
jgi:hypothetical protein